MSIAHLLEHFDSHQIIGTELHVLPDEALEEQRLEAFERGYSAGWEDAIKAQSDDKAQLNAELIHSLEDLSFTYQEALTQMTVSLEPMFQTLMTLVLPQTIDKGLVHHIADQLRDIARAEIAQPVQVVVPEGVSYSLSSLLDHEFQMPVEVIEDARLLPGQAQLSIGTSERELDFNSLMASIDDALTAFLHQAKEVSKK